MAISYVGGVAGGRAGATTTTTQSISGTLTGGLASSPSAGDLVVVWCSSGGDGTGAAPAQTVSGNTSGTYSTGTAQSITTATYDAFAQFNYKIQGATPDTTITIPSSGNARNAQRWAIHVFRGVDAATPLDVTPTYATGTATGRPNPALIAPSTAGSWILWCGASAAATGAAYTAPTDFATNWRGGTTADTADCMDGCGYYTGWTSGNYDPAAITAGGTTNAADSWVATTVALRPAANNYTLTCNNGTYSVSGQSVTVSRNRVLTPSNGTYSYTGQSVDIQKVVSYILTAQHGTYSVTGQDAVIERDRQLTASFGSYAYTGQSVWISRDKLITASNGTYTLTGQGAAVNRNLVLTASHGTYSVSGQSAGLYKSKWINALTTNYTMSGQSADISKNKVISAQNGSYSVSGQSADIAYSGGAGGYTLLAQSGSYAVSGQSIQLDKARVYYAESGAYSVGEYYVADGYLEDGYFGNTVITYTPVSVQPEKYSGGFDYPDRKRKSDADIKAERIALGILPPEVAKIANKVAQKAINRATEQQQSNVLEWVLQAEQQALYERQLRMEMSRRQQVWDSAYSRLLEIAVQEALQKEEEAVLMMMMEL